ncbi:MAG: DEAD/DEAH box helicase family protein [Candidatus Nanopelagicales bacterium]
MLDLYRAGRPRRAADGHTADRGGAGRSTRHPKYCFKMATGTGKTWVLQALMIWQLLNKTAMRWPRASTTRASPGSSWWWRRG